MTVLGIAVVCSALVALTVLVLLSTGPGHRLVGRWVVRALNGAIDGHVTIGDVGGQLWHSADVRDVTFTSLDGRPVIRAERVQVRYSLLDLVRKRFRFAHVQVDHPVVNMVQGTDGRWNIERLFRADVPHTGPKTRRPLVELNDAVVTDGTLTLHESRAGDSVIERSVRGLNADLAHLRLSHPDSTGLQAVFRNLAAQVRNPDLIVTKADGAASLDGDSLRFAFDHVNLPATAATASGRVKWGGSNTDLDAAVNARRFAFADVRGFVPAQLKLPEDGGGSLAMHLRLHADGSNEVILRDVRLRSGRSVVAGRLNLTISAAGGVVFREMELALKPFDFAALKPYADSLPVHGLVRGRFRGAGALGNLTVDEDLAWADEAVPGAPVNIVRGRGRLAFGGDAQLGFEAFTLQHADFDARTLRHFAPSVKLEGRLSAEGSLDGPWRDASFRGGLVQSSGDLASGVHGSLRLGLSTPARIDADLDVDSLSLALLQHTYPGVPLLGTLRGHARIHGPMDTLRIEASLRGAAGMMTGAGVVGARDSAVTVALEGAFDSLDLHRVSAALPPSVLAGTWGVDLVVPLDSAQPPTGTAKVALLPGLVSGVGVTGGGILARIEAQRVHVDSLRLDFAGGTARVSGGLGRGAGLPAQLTFLVRADTVAYLEPLALWLLRQTGDSSAVKFDGSAQVSGRLEGTTDAWQLDFLGNAQGVNWGGNTVRGARVNGRLVLGAHGYSVAATGSADTVVAAGLAYTPVGISASGPLDSLTVRATGGFHESSAVRTALTIAGDTLERRIRLDSLELDLASRRWRLTRPVRLVLNDQVLRLDTLELRPTIGRGLVRAAGSLPRAGAGAFEVTADSVPIADVYALMQRDTTGIAGTAGGLVTLTGSSASPAIYGHITLDDGHFGDYGLPRLDVTSHYRDQRLTLVGGLWRDSLRLVGVTGSMPLDLSLRAVGDRQLPGSLEISAHADSLDMAVLGALTTVLTGVTGTMGLDVKIGGTWDDPTFAGLVDVRGGAMRIPSLGARYTGMDARLVLENKQIRVERGTILSVGGGRLDIAGRVLFEALDHPSLELTLTAARFAAYDIRNFGALTATGSLTLRGPAIGATLSGRLLVEDGYLQFKDLVEKRIVSLDDPEFRALVDTNLQRASELGPGVHTIFFDSLRITDLTVTMGADVWMRSSEASFQLAGEFNVQRTFEEGAPRYRLDGTLHAIRGTYRLILGKANSIFAIAREFRVARGTLRFLGTQDFNPELDIVAEHVVRTVQRSQLVVRVLIGGTLLYPELHLESDQRPPLTETEIASYLMFGQPPSTLEGQGIASRQNETVLAQALGSSIVGGVGSALVSELGLPLDYFTIVPGVAQSGNAFGVTEARIEAGAQLGSRTFLTLNAGLCEVRTARLVGAALEYRLSSRWTVSAAFEPVVQSCGTATGLSELKSHYQLGFDLFWQQGIR